MTPDPFIRDAAFRGSPILSYGRANRGSAWPKFLALGAGIFVLLAVTVLSWFWFLTNIPMPKDTVVFAILPGDIVLNTKAPLVWKQTQVLNRPIPTIVGLAGVDAKGSGQETSGYAIRLSPATAIIGKTRLWHLVSNEELIVEKYFSPFEVFGWPWEMFKGEMRLDVAVSDLFSDGDLKFDNLPNYISGTIIGNKWKTDLPVNHQDNVIPLTSFGNISGFAPIEAGALDVLRNFLQINGAWIHFSDPGVLTWVFDQSTVTINTEGLDKSGVLMGSVVSEELSTYQPFTLPDGEVVYRQYINTAGTSTASVMATTSEMGLMIDRQNSGISTNFVSNLTCDGEMLAGFDAQSIQNFCSWVDICYFDFKNIVFLNEAGYLTACGY